MEHYKLSKREIEVMGYIALELTDNEIAEFIHLSSIAVRKMGQRIRDKIGARNRVGIAVFIAKEGLV